GLVECHRSRGGSHCLAELAGNESRLLDYPSAAPESRLCRSRVVQGGMKEQFGQSLGQWPQRMHREETMPFSPPLTRMRIDRVRNGRSALRNCVRELHGKL